MSVSKEARTIIDDLYAKKITVPSLLIWNLEQINIKRENEAKELLAIPLFKDLYNYIARLKKEIETTPSQTEIPTTQNSIENNAKLDSIEAIEQLLTVPAFQKSNIIPALATTIEAVASKKRGRPPGSKNKPKSPCSVNYLNKKRSPKKKKSKLDS